MATSFLPKIVQGQSVSAARASEEGSPDRRRPQTKNYPASFYPKFLQMDLHCRSLSIGSCRSVVSLLGDPCSSE